MNYKIMLFDLDDTLYSGKSGIWAAIINNIYQFMIEKLGIPADEVHPLREELFKKYGTTFRGLTELYDFDKMEYMNYVHNLPLEDFLTTNLPLREMLENYPVKKYIFTNADTNHARRITNILGVLDLFEDTIVDVIQMFPYCKPMPEAFAYARKMTGNLPAEEIVFVDDSLPNILSAKELGFQVVWLNKNKLPALENIPTIYDIMELKQVLPAPNGNNLC